MNASDSDDDLRDERPDDINAADFVGAYRFPDNSRRRIPGYIYLVMAVILVWRPEGLFPAASK